MALVYDDAYYCCNEYAIAPEFISAIDGNRSASSNIILQASTEKKIMYLKIKD